MQVITKVELQHNAFEPLVYSTRINAQTIVVSVEKPVIEVCLRNGNYVIIPWHNVSSYTMEEQDDDDD